MIFLRSLVFQILFYVSNIAQMVFWTPTFFFMPRPMGWKVVRLWAKSHLWLQHVIVGTRYEFRGLENIPTDRPFIIASKHQSNWETYTTLIFFPDPSFVLKRELIRVPLLGWYMAKMKVVPVDRGKRSEALASMARHAAVQYRENRQIIIYPEGTRTRPGAPPKYKFGIVHLYHQIGANILPVAVNSGLYWPKGSFIVRPGTIILEFLPVIEPGLSKEEFTAELVSRIESASDRLNAEAAASDNPPPLALAIRDEGKEAA